MNSEARQGADLLGATIKEEGPREMSPTMIHVELRTVRSTAAHDTGIELTEREMRA